MEDVRGIDFMDIWYFKGSPAKKWNFSVTKYYIFDK